MRYVIHGLVLLLIGPAVLAQGVFILEGSVRPMEDVVRQSLTPPEPYVPQNAFEELLQSKWREHWPGLRPLLLDPRRSWWPELVLDARDAAPAAPLERLDDLLEGFALTWSTSLVSEGAWQQQAGSRFVPAVHHRIGRGFLRILTARAGPELLRRHPAAPAGPTPRVRLFLAGGDEAGRRIEEDVEAVLREIGSPEDGRGGREVCDP